MAESAGSLATQIISAAGGSVALLAFARYFFSSMRCSLKSRVHIPGGEFRVSVGVPPARQSSSESSESTAAVLPALAPALAPNESRESVHVDRVTPTGSKESARSMKRVVARC